MGTTDIRYCKICQRPLSVYNSTDQCLHHGVDEKIQLSEGVLFVTKGDITKNVRETKVRSENSNNELVEKLTLITIKIYGIKRNELFGTSRQHHIVHARQMFMYILHKKLNRSCVDVGKILSRDHTTVLHGCEKVECVIKTVPHVAQNLESIYQALFT